MPDIYLPREIANAWDGDNFVQDAWKQVSDIWAQQANAASPDLALQAEQQVQQKAIEDQRAQERAAYQQQSDAATQAGLQQAMQEQYGQQQAQQWAAQAYGQAATAATGVAPLPTAPAAPAATDQSQPAPDQAQPAQPAQAAPDTSGMPSGAAGNYVAAAWQAAQKYGLDPSVFVRQIQQESGFQPFMPDGSVKVSPAGARGIAQFMPGTAKDVGVNPDDPLASLDAAAKTMAGYVQRYGGDMAKALAAYNAGPGNVDKFGGVPPFSETQSYVKTILGDAAGLGPQLAAKAQQGLGDLGQAATGAAQAVQDTGAAAGQQAQDAGAGAMRVVNAAVQTVASDLRPSQFGVGLSSSEAEAACGPVAAMAFARATGRNPTAEEAVQLAKQVGWTAANGMAGPASELSLLKSMGVAAHMEQGADPTKIAQDVTDGNPVIISTPGHYFVADKFDPATGAFRVGTSGTDLKAGSAWMSLGQMQKVMGQAQATLYLDRQPGDGPSVAAQMTQGGDSQQPQAQQAQPQQPLTMSAMQPADIPSAPANGPSGFNPFRAVGDLAGGVGSAVGGAFGSLLGAGGGLLNRPQAGPTDNPGALASPAMPPSSPDQLPFGGRTAADLITEPLKPVAQGAAGLLGQALQPAAQGATDLLDQPGGPLAGPKAAAAGALNDLAGQVPANVPVVGGALNAAAGLITAPTILDNVQTMQDLAQKYPSRASGLPDVSSMTPEDQQAYQNASLAVGGMASPLEGGRAFQLTTEAGPGRTPLTDEQLATHVQGISDYYDQLSQRAEELENRITGGSYTRGSGGFRGDVVRPPWAAGWTDDALRTLAQRNDLNPYQDGWWEAGNFVKGSGELREDVGQSGLKGTGRRQQTAAQARQELGQVRTEQDRLIEQSNAIDNAPEGTTFYMVEPQAPEDIPFDAGVSDTGGNGAATFGPSAANSIAGPPTSLEAPANVAAAGALRPPNAISSPAPTASQLTPALRNMGMPDEQIAALRSAANPPPQVNPLDNGIGPKGADVPPISTNPSDFESNLQGALKQLVLPGMPAAAAGTPRAPGSFWQVLNAYHSGNVVMGPATLAKVAANSIVAPAWDLTTQSARDLLTMNVDRVTGRVWGAGQALVNMGSDFMDGFGQAMTNRTTSSIPLVDNLLMAQRAVGGAAHAGLQNVTAEMVRRMELGAAAGEQVAAQNGRGVAGLGQIADLIRDPSGLPADAVARANDLADRAGLRSPAGAVQQTVQNMLNQAANTPVGAVTNFLLPVFRIGAQAAARGIEASPIGLAGTGVDVARGAAGFGPYAGGFSQTGGAVTPLADRLTNNLAGTALTAWLASKALDGTVTGVGPEDPRARANLEAQGWRPQSVLVPGIGYVSYARVPEQLRTPLELAGGFGDASTMHKGDPGAVALEMTRQVKEMLAKGMPGISTLADLGGILKGDPYAVGFLVGGSAAGYIPGSAVLSNLASAADPLARQIPTKQGFGPAILGSIEQGLPGLREQLQPSVNVLGQNVPNPAAGLAQLLPVRTPGEVAPNTPGLQGLRVLNASGVVLPAAPPQLSMANGKSVQMTDDERQQFDQFRSVLLDQVVGPLATNASFTAAPPAAQKQILDRLLQKVDTAASRQVLGSIAQSGDLMSRVGPAGRQAQNTATLIRPPLPLNELQPVGATSSAPARTPLPLADSFADLDPVQQQEQRRRLLGY